MFYSLSSVSKKVLVKWYYEGKLKERSICANSYHQKVAVIDMNEDYTFGYIANPTNNTIKFFKVKTNLKGEKCTFKVGKEVFNADDFLRVGLV